MSSATAGVLTRSEEVEAESPGMPAWAWRAFGLMGLAVVAAFLAARGAPVAQAWMFTGLSAASTLAIAAALRAYRPPRRGPWVLLLAAHSVYAGCLLGWYVYPVAWGGSLAYPSFLDVMYWATYLGWAAFLLMLEGGPGKVDRRVVLDSVIAAVALGSVGWYFLLDSVIQDPGLPATVRLASSVYVLLLVLLASLAVRLVLAGGQPRVVGALLVGWVSAELVGDAWYARAGAAGTFAYGDPWFVGWMLSYVLLGMLALHPDMARLGAVASPPAPSTRGWRLVLLGGSVSVPGLLSVVEAARDHFAEAVVFSLLALVTMALVLLRLHLAGRDLNRERELREELERLGQDLWHRSRHDSLTGLVNRTAFDEALTQALRRRPVSGAGPALLLVDLDSFKAVNDTFGHHIGDLLLQETARRLSSVVRPEDVVARLGGDEFAVILERTDTPGALALARRVSEALVEPLVADDAWVRPGASIGVHLLVQHEDAAQALIKADGALYSAKDAGGGVHLYDEQSHRRFVDRYRTETELRAAVRREELELHYQPVLDLRRRRVVGAEALVRWRHPERGLLSPAAFMDVAEESGIVVEIGGWVLDRACADAAAWRAEMPEAADVSVAVNVSRRQLENTDFVDQVLDVLHIAGLAPSALTLEITETALARRGGNAISQLEKLSHAGVEIAMDDFGTGYSSLAELRTLPVDVLKIDRAFVDGIAREEQEWALAVAILKIASGLGKRTVAEGIETGSQLAHLITLGADLGQGYLFARPMPLAEFLEWLREHQRP